MSRIAPRSIVLPVLVLAAHAALAGESAPRAVSLRYRFRPGETWRERVLHEVEVRGEKGDVVSSRRTERTDIVEVVSVDAGGGAVLRRRPEPRKGSAPEEPFEYGMSARGEVSASGESEAAGEDPAPAPLSDRFAPVLPPGALLPGEGSGREIETPVPGCGVFFATETATLAGTERVGGRETAKLALKRRAGDEESVMLVEALRAPERDAWLAVTEPARVRLEVTGLAGEGELVFDTFAGKLVSYGMLETTALEATLVSPADGAPFRIFEEETVHWTVTVRYEVERVD